MFRRRQRRKPHQRLCQLIWPDMGFVRLIKYIGHRVGRLPDTPYAISAGFAFGAAISFTPLMGFHIALAVGFAWLWRSNVIAAVLGTAVGNPWTFPLIWLTIYLLGGWMLGRGWSAGLPPDFSAERLFELFWALFLPMLVGGLPLSVIAWLAFFWPGRYLVATYQRNRLDRRFRRAVSKEAREATERC